MVRIGKYQHYKGNFYEVLFTGTHTETLKEYVIYKALYKDTKFGENHIWIRPLEMFLENVTIDGKEVPRFKFVE